MSTFVVLTSTSTLIPTSGIIAGAVSLTVSKSIELQTDLSALPLAAEKTTVNADYVIEITEELYDTLAALGVSGLEIVEEELDEADIENADIDAEEAEEEEAPKRGGRRSRKEPEPEPEPEILEPNVRYYLRHPLSDAFTVAGAPVPVQDTAAFEALSEDDQNRVINSLTKMGELIERYTASPELTVDDDDDFPLTRNMASASLTASVQATQESRDELHAKIVKRINTMTDFLSPEEESEQCTLEELSDILNIDEDAMADLTARIRHSANTVLSAAF